MDPDHAGPAAGTGTHARSTGRASSGKGGPARLSDRPGAREAKSDNGIADNRAEGTSPEVAGRAATPRRKRRTKEQIGQLWYQMYRVLEADHPQSVRHVFYRMTDPRLPEPVAKSEGGYTTVQRQLVKMRLKGIVPYGWITDATRRGYFTPTWSGPAAAVRHVASLYRRNYWTTAQVYVEVWVESRSIAGIVQADCEELCVPLYPAGGFSSHTLTWESSQKIQAAQEAAQHIAPEARGRPVHILYLGDYDAAGLLIDRKIEAQLRRHLPGQELHFHRLAVTAEQIALMRLPTKPGKEGDRRGGFTGGTVEAEAMPAGVMRRLLRDAVERFMDPHELAVLRAAEESERLILRWAADGLREALGSPS
jgi:hypothetical protein